MPRSGWGRAPSAPARLGLLLALAVCLAVRPALAQTTTSALTGVVLTPAGEPATGATVRARSEAIGAERTAVTDAEGRYRLDLLPPGSWDVVARLGEDVSQVRGVVLRLQETRHLDFVLAPGRTEEVVVRAEAPLVDPTRSSTELRVQRDQVEELPLPGRDAVDLAKLDSSVRAAPPGNLYGERGSAFIINGQTGRSNSFLVDGLDNNDQTSGTTSNAFFSQQVVREFVVLTSQYAPEFGRASGGVVNIVTRRGGNDAGAGFFAQGFPARWNPSGDFVSSLPETPGQSDSLERLQTGFHLEGPFRKDKAFYFLSYERQEIHDPLPYTGVDRRRVAGGVADGSSRDDNVFVRTDFNLGGKHFLMARLSADGRTSENLNVGGVTTPEAGFHLDERDAQLAVALTSVPSDELLNEARFLLGHSSFDQFANSSRPGVERPSGIFGGNNLNLQARDEDRFQFVDNVTLRKERHTMKFGFDLLRSRTRAHTRFNPNGNFLYETDAPFEPGDCGDLIASQVAKYGKNPIPCPGVVGVDDDGDGQVDEPGLIGTYPVVFQLIEGEPRVRFDDTRLALFAQDTWQIGPRVLMNYGLRYDLSTYRLPSEIRIPSVIPNGGAGRDWNDLAPRLGFTVKPAADSPWVIRGGAGVFYDKLVLAFPAVSAVTSGTEIGLLFPQGLTLEVTEDVVEQVGIDTLRDSLFFPPELVLRFSTGTRLDTPYTVQYSLGAERAIGRMGALRINLVRALGYHVPLMRDLNPVVDVDAQGIPIHRDPAFGSIAAVVTEGRSWYAGLDLGWRWGTEDSWYSASYTWSRAEDLGPDPLKGGISLPPNSDDIADEKGRSDADRRHRLVLAGAAPLPWARLHLSGVVQLASGVPFNVTTGRDENLDGISTDRPPGVGRNTGENTPLGPVNAIREEEGLPLVTSLREPSFFQVDLRVWRPFKFLESRGDGQVFLQVFNLLDRFNGGPVEGRVTSTNFGEPVGLAGPPRTYELGLKLEF